MLAWWPALLGVLAGCGGGDDGVNPDGSNGGCSAETDTCTGDSICIAGRCEAAFGRLYDITNVQVQLPTTDSSGAAWDIGGGAPDIFVAFVINGTSTVRTPTTQDQFSTSYAGPFTVQPIGGGSFEAQVFDEDVTVDDLAFICMATPLTADLLRGRLITCNTTGYVVSLRIDPR